MNDRFPASVEANGRERIVRFDRCERVVHWVMALDVLVVIATGLILYLPALEERVGRRLLVENVHTVAGLGCVVPLAAALVLPAGRMVRADLVRIARVRPAEWRWFDRTTRIRVDLDKFNPGQKLAAVLIGSGLVVLAGTGIMLRFPGPFRLSLREGATFVHDWFAAGVSALVLGHIVMALAHPRALVAMVRGTTTRGWARQHASAWLAELDSDGELHSGVPCAAGELQAGAGAPGPTPGAPGA